MISKYVLAKLAIISMIIVFFVNMAINLPSSSREIPLFPGILGNTGLDKNETGKQVIANIVSHDEFDGNIIQGYKATYSGDNGTIIIFVARMSDNVSANKSFNDMIDQTGYNRSLKSNQSIKNNATVIKLPVENPEVFVIRKNKNDTLHYTFTKLDKVYWIGFSKWDIEYHASMLMEIYINVDRQKSIFDV